MNGPNIPHTLHFSVPDDEDWDRPSIAVLQFSRDSLGSEFLQKNELQTVREFLDEARYGFEFHGQTRDKAHQLILEMSDQSPLEQFIQTLRILEPFANSNANPPCQSGLFPFPKVTGYLKIRRDPACQSRRGSISCKNEPKIIVSLLQSKHRKNAHRIPA